MKQEAKQLITKYETEIKEIQSKAIKLIEKADSKLEVCIASPFEIVEFRCENCGSEKIEDGVYDDDDNPSLQFVGFQCKECDHFTVTREERN